MKNKNIEFLGEIWHSFKVESIEWFLETDVLYAHTIYYKDDLKAKKRFSHKFKAKDNVEINDIIKSLERLHYGKNI